MAHDMRRRAAQQDQTAELLELAAARAAAYLSAVERRAVAPDDAAVQALARFDEALPQAPADARAVLELLDDAGSPATLATAGPRFFGFVIGGALPVTVAASWLATAWDQNAGAVLASPVAARLEAVAEGWLNELLGLPRDAVAAFVTGATVANFTALAAARHAVLARRRLGRRGRRSVRRAARHGGAGRRGAPLGAQVAGHARPGPHARGGAARGRAGPHAAPTALPRLAPPCIVVLQAGNVNTGAFDPFAELVPWAREAGAWVHVDGAFGLWAAAAPARRALLAGAAGADSWATDAHKWLNVPYDSGLAFVADRQALQAAMAVTAAYLPFDEQREPAAFTPELSRRARGVEVWAALRTLGRDGVAELVERCCRHAQRFAEGLRREGFEVLNDVVLNQVLVSFGDEAVTRRVIELVQRDATLWAGGTVWQGHTAMRLSVSSWATGDEDVERSLEAITRCAREAGRRPDR